jgi:predicted dithiol-disulfide oxidoreductase (DUF899 family)
MNAPQTANRDEWLAARKALLAEEKELLRKRDELSAKRRALPWVKVEEDYHFQGPDCEMTLADLFGDKSQLIVQHFMLGADWEEGCPSCSFWADGFNGTTEHIAHRDAAFVCVSNAPLVKIETYKKRMGWDFDWVSCQGSNFNYDYHASFTPEEMKKGKMEYNYRETSFPANEAPAVSIFAKDHAGNVYHTYSCYSRGLDNMNVTYQYLDLLPKGRDEDDLPHSMAWVKRHDQYV